VLVQTGGVAVGEGVGVGTGRVADGDGVDPVPGRPHAARSDVAAAIASSPGVVRRI
jgi:hypothetical protein